MYKYYQTHQINQAAKQSWLRVFLSKSPRFHKLILKYVLNFANSPIFPSHETIAKEVGCSVRTVAYALQRLRAAGLLSWKQRYNNSNWYTLSDYLRTPETMKWLRSYFVGFMSIMLLVPFYSYSKQELQPKILNDINLSKNKEQTASQEATAYKAMMLVPKAASQMLPAGTWQYGIEEGEPNPKRTRLEFDSMIYKKEQHMQQFTEEQLQQLTQYPKESVTYANKKLTSDLLAGKSISNQFSYLLGICRSHAAERNAPKREQGAPYNKQKVLSRHIDPALLQPLTEEAKMRRADERRQEWERKHGPKKHDCFYMPPRTTMQPQEQPSISTKPTVASVFGAILTRDRQPSLFQDDEPPKLDYDALDEILD